jgi:flagellar basal body P-ring formation protein FlgA
MIRMATFLLLALTVPATAQVNIASGPLPFTERFAAYAPRPDRTTGPAIKPTVTIVGDIVRIGDLVENAGAAAHIGIFRSPGLGETGRVSVDRILDALLPHELLKVDTRGLTEVVVTRASTIVAPKDIETRIARALAGRQRNAEPGNLTLTFDSELRAIHLEPGTDLRLLRLAFDPRSGRFDITFERPGSRNVLRYIGTYAETFEALALARPLTAGDIVKASDVVTVRRPKAQFTANVITAANQAIGLAARRTMRPGDTLRQTDLARPEIVIRNDNVTITYQVPGVTLTMRGKALESGALGDTINVINVQSKRSIQAVVAGPGHVMVAATTLVSVTPATTPPRLAAEATGRPRSNTQSRVNAE